MSNRPLRNTAEWIVFAVCCGVVLLVVGLLTAELLGPEDRAAPIAKQHGEIRQVAGRYFVPVEVWNEGDLTAADVQVVAELTVEGEVTDGEQLVSFLAGGETERLVFSFDHHPDAGELVVRVGSYAQP